MKTLKSFGCSFVYGTDFAVTDFADSIREFSGGNKHPEFFTVSIPSVNTWPALIAKKLDLDYECHALPGQGNFKIYCDILANSYLNDDSVYMINWTWIDRYDYVDSQEHWNTLRPAQENDLQNFYYRNLHSQIHDMIASASWIVSAAEHLESLHIPYVMTYMDYNLLTPIDPNWHDPRYLEVLQQKLKKILIDFDGVNFLDWSRKNGFKISDTLHPLEAAHTAAADYWLPFVKKLV